MSRFILYGTVGCHLCELAEQALSLQLAVPAFSAYEIECIDISDSDALLERYALTIPVLRRVSDEQELSWPFDEMTLRDFLLGAAR